MPTRRRQIFELRERIDARRTALELSYRAYADHLGVPGLASIINGPPTRRLRPDEADRLATDLGIEREWFDPIVSETAVRRVRAPRGPADRTRIPLRTAFGRWVSRQLAQRDLTPEGLAERSGISPVSIRDWQRGELLPSPVNARRLALGLDLDPDVLSATLKGLRDQANEQPEPLPETTVISLLDAVPRAREQRAFRRSR
ncbi:MAG: helix-turn-helix domain-containing protein [Acidimicrobiia bacterium]